jgi:hypothetical protein
MGVHNNNEKLATARDKLVAGKASMVSGNDRADEVAALFVDLEQKKSEGLDAARTVLQGLQMAAEGLDSLLAKLPEATGVAKRLGTTAAQCETDYKTAFDVTIETHHVLNQVLGPLQTAQLINEINDGTHSAFSDYQRHAVKARDAAEALTASEIESNIIVQQVGTAIDGIKGVIQQIAGAGRAEEAEIIQFGPHRPDSQEKVVERAATVAYFESAIEAVNNHIT